MTTAGSVHRVLAGVVTLALVAGLALAAPASGAPAATEQRSLDAAALGADVDPDTVRLQVRAHPDGTATWTVEYRIRLEGDREAGFEDLAADVRAAPGDAVSEFLQVLRPSVDRAAADTGREMALRNGSVTAERRALARPTGVVTYRFEWAGFAEVGEDRLAVGDALSGFYVDEDTVLRIEWPSAYEPAATTPDPDEGGEDAVVWHGPTDFGTDEPRVELVAADDGLATVPVAVLLSVVVLAAVGAAGHLGGDRGRSSDGVEDGPAATDGLDGPSDPDLLTNEERVVSALEANGGRMKQQELAEALEWGAPKTSRVVTDLRDEEAVDVFRLGRENVVALPGEELL